MSNMKRVYWIAFLTLTKKELIRIFRIWPQTILPTVITISLYFMIFGHVIGSQLAAVKGFTYMQYIVPGLVMMPVITNSYINTGFSFYGAKFSRSIEEVLVAPVPAPIMLMGFVCGGLLRSIIISTLVLIIASFFTPLHIHSVLLSIIMIIITALIFAIGGIINGIFATKFDDVSIIPTFLLTPLTYLGGVFYTINQLPTWAQYASKANPIFYIINGFRQAMLGVSDVNAIYAFAILITLLIILFSWAVYLLNNSYGLRG